MEHFFPVYILFFKAIAFVFLVTFIGLVIIFLLNGKKHVLMYIQAKEYCMAFLIGFLSVLTLSYVSLRIFTIFKLDRPFKLSLITLILFFIAILLIFAFKIVKRNNTRKFKFNYEFVLLIYPIIIGFFLLIPMLIQSDLLYFAGSASDASGYIRGAQSIIEEWYFSPPKSFDMNDILYSPDRGWTYYIISINDRPLTYYVIAWLSTLMKVNVFQGYLLSGTLAIVIISTYYMLLIQTYVNKRLHKLILSLLIPLLIVITAIPGNFFHQFLGQIWCNIVIIVFLPIIFMYSIRFNKIIFSMSIAGFIFSLLCTAIYDFRFTIITYPIILISLLFHLKIKKPKKIFLFFLSMCLSFLLSTYLIFTNKTIDQFKSLFQGINIPYEVTLYDFFVNFIAGATLEKGTLLSLYLFGLLVLVVLVGGILSIKYYIRTWKDNNEEYQLIHLLTALLFFSILFLTALLLYKKDYWTANKILYLLMPILTAFGLIQLISNFKLFKKVNITAMIIIVSIAGFSIFSFQQILTRYTHVVKNNEPYGTLNSNGLIKMAKELEKESPELIWFDGNMQDYLNFMTIYRMEGTIILAPYDLWYGGGGIYPRVFPDKLTPNIEVKSAYKEILNLAIIKNNNKMVVISTNSKFLENQRKCFSKYCYVNTTYKTFFDWEKGNATKIEGTSGDWLLPEGTTIKVSNKFVELSQGIILSGDITNFTNTQNLVAKTQQNELLYSTYSVNGSKYKIYIEFPKNKDDKDLVINIKFDNYFIPKDIQLNDDTRKLSVLIPKSITLVDSITDNK